MLVEACQVGLSGQEAAHAADGVLDAALLPRRVRVAEVGADAQGVEVVMASELGAVVEGDGLPEWRWQSAKTACDGLATGSACLGRRDPIRARLIRSCSIRMFWP